MKKKIYKNGVIKMSAENKKDSNILLAFISMLAAPKSTFYETVYSYQIHARDGFYICNHPYFAGFFGILPE